MYYSLFKYLCVFYSFQYDCLKKRSRGKNSHDIKQGSSGSPLELVDYILLAFAGVLVVFLSIGALRNAFVTKKHASDATIGLYLST